MFYSLIIRGALLVIVSALVPTLSFGAIKAQAKNYLQEAEAAIREVLDQAQPVELTPQNNYLRRMQHQLAERYGLTTESRGVEPHRRVVIYPV